MTATLTAITTAPSYKQMIKDGDVKRADAMKVRLEDLHEEPGFNLREEGADLDASIEALADHIFDGGQYPALEVRPRAESGVWIVDGHRRRRAIARAIDKGAPLADKDGTVWVNIVPFVGNDADRTARILTSAEGRALTPLETAMGYKRLRNLGWDNARIAKKVGKTTSHVAQRLLLADANSDVQQMVSAGMVAATEAERAVRKHGEAAGKFLDSELGKAKAAGKTKVTAGVIKGKALPPKVVSGLVGSVDAFMEALPVDTRTALASIEFSKTDASAPVTVPAGALLALLKSHAEVTEARNREADRTRGKAAEAAQVQIAA
ncbi:ParB/RepB/Spo0J family partition protein [Cupriavidus basilensis]